MTQIFWKPEPIRPIPPEQGWIAKLLRWSLWISSAGWIVYGVFAFAFDDIKVIPLTVQSWMVVIGSALIVTGAELNTAPTAVAVFHKVGAKQHQRMDIYALIASFVGSILSALITFGIRQSRFGETIWRQLVLSWGPLIAGIAVAADYYAASAELGLLRSDFERAMAHWLERMEQWLREEAEWNAAHGIPEPVDRSRWPVARFEDVRAIVAQGLNGERDGLTTDNWQERIFDKERLRVPEPQAPSTRRRWLETLQSGG